MDFPRFNTRIGTSKFIKPFISIIKNKKIFNSVTVYSNFHSAKIMFLAFDAYPFFTFWQPLLHRNPSTNLRLSINQRLCCLPCISRKIRLPLKNFIKINLICINQSHNIPFSSNTENPNFLLLPLNNHSNQCDMTVLAQAAYISRKPPLVPEGTLMDNPHVFHLRYTNCIFCWSVYSCMKNMDNLCNSQEGL